MDREALGGLFFRVDLQALVDLVYLQSHIHPAEQHKELSNTLTLDTGWKQYSGVAFWMTFGPGGPGTPGSPWKSNQTDYSQQELIAGVKLRDPVRIHLDDHTFGPALPGGPGAPTFPVGPWKHNVHRPFI